VREKKLNKVKSKWGRGRKSERGGRERKCVCVCVSQIQTDRHTHMPNIEKKKNR
jgi:hypothetical protein